MLRNFIYNLGYIVRLGFRFSILYKEYIFMKKNQFKTIKANLSIQKELLFKLVENAIKQVPYYKKIAENKDIRIKKETIFKDIRKFPILTKELIRKNWDLLHSDLENLKFKIETSGGTTGEPIKIIQDWNYRTKTEAGTRFLNEIGGYKIGDKLIKLWGNEKEILEASRGKINYLINKYIKNERFQNSFRMSDTIILQYINEINLIKPKVIIAYVQSIHEMAKYIRKNKINIYPLKSIIVSAGVLTNKVKDYLEKIFNCKVFNRYGSREIGPVATSCEKSDKLHVNMYQQYIEILDDNNNSLKEHEKGNIIITNLTNQVMPLIRYRIGDLGSLDFSQCPCGRGLIRLENIFGRIVDVFKTKDGELIDGEYFTHLFYFRENIKKFQVVQEKLDLINVFLVTVNNKHLFPKEELELKIKIKLVMGKNCKVKFFYPTEIKPSSSGKFRYTISKI